MSDADLPDFGPDFGYGALIAQRLCHDLVNPLGAVGNGLELMAMDRLAPTAEQALMADSLAQALGRIKLYRLAFGTTGTGGSVAGVDLAAALAVLGGSRRIDRTTTLSPSVPRPDARLLALMALAGETALAWGGALDLRADGTILRVRAEAPRLRTDGVPWAALADGAPPPGATPALVHFACLPPAARAAGRRVEVAMEPGRLTLTA